jgi:hypothetical protein
MASLGTAGALVDGFVAYFAFSHHSFVSSLLTALPKDIKRASILD